MTFVALPVYDVIGIRYDIGASDIFFDWFDEVMKRCGRLLIVLNPFHVNIADRHYRRGWCLFEVLLAVKNGFKPYVRTLVPSLTKIPQYFFLSLFPELFIF